MSDVSKTNELIVAKLRKVAKQAEWYQALDTKLLTAAADALEAATRVPVQGEPNDAAEQVVRGALLHMGDMLPSDVADLVVERLRKRGLLASHATVPDAATEGDYHEGLEEGSKIGRGERDAALAAVDRVRVLHPVAYSGNSRSRNAFCATCTTMWPCATIRALDGAPEPEREREYRRVRPDGVPVFNAVFETMPLLDDYYTAEYRTVSPWLPVEGESK